MIRLVDNTISTGDIDRLARWLSTYPKLTKGEVTAEFEQKFSDWLGVKYSVFVNSGSSANLLMVYLLKYKYGVTRIAVPALSWSTDIAPLIQLGIEPVLIDCNMDDLSLDLEHLEDELTKGVEAVLLVSVLGLVPQMLRLTQICEKHGVILIEDNCESLGSQQGIRKLGTYGLMSSFSFFFGHHISTIEGGMICTDDEEVYELLLMFRSHGWRRDLGHCDFEEMYRFYVPGFNVRSTDLQAYIGLMQLDRLKEYTLRRFDNFKHYLELFKESGLWVPKPAWFDFVSNMAYPVISEDKAWAVKRLLENGVECRPLIAGSMGTQPFYTERYGEKHLPNADYVDKYGFYVPNHQNMTITDIERVSRLILSYG